MKKSVLLLAICGTLCGYTNSSFAVSPIYGITVDGCYSWTCVGGANSFDWYPNSSPSERNCASYSAACVHYSQINGTSVATCTACNPGYELAQGSAGITACSRLEDGSDEAPSAGRYNYTYCTKNCNSTTCAPTSWTALRTGYETRTNRTCSTTGTSGTCNSTPQYRCAAGFWGSSTNGTSGCSQCPPWTGVYTNSAKTTEVRGTSPAGTTAITGCYVAPGTYYDATGTFKTTSNCAH